MIPKSMFSTLLSVIIFTGAYERHQGTTIHITVSKIHISYSENYDSTLIFYYFYMSPLPTLAYIIAKGSTFSISFPFEVTELQQQKIVLMSHRLAAFRSEYQWTRIFTALTTPMTIGTQLGFKRNRESHYSSQCSRKLRVRHYYQ